MHSLLIEPPEAFVEGLLREVNNPRDAATTRRRTRKAPILTTPKAGNFYQIQYGKGGLLTTAGRTYGVGAGGERLRFARMICAHPLNRAFLVPPKNAYERKFFPNGLVSFLKHFTCTVPQRRAKSGEKRCYATIWIPPRQGGSPFSPPATFLAPARARTMPDTVRTLLTALDSGPFCKRRFLDLVVGEDDRERVPPASRTRVPFRWACKIVAIFAANSRGERPIGQASGVLLTPTRLVTNAHVLSNDLDVPEALIVIPGFSKPHPADVNALDDDAAPFGVWFVPRYKTGGAANFHIAREFRALGDYAADYGTVELDGARRIGKPTGSISDGWLSVSRNLALTAPQAASPQGEDGPVDGSATHTRKLIRRLGANSLKTAGYPADRVCEMMLAKDRVRPLEYTIHWTSGGRAYSGNDYPDTIRHATVASRLDTTFGNSGGPVWLERLVVRHEGNRRVKRRQFILAGILQGGTHPVSERIDFRGSTPGRVVRAAPASELDVTNHTSSEAVVLTPFVLDRLLHPGMMLPA